MRCRRAHTGYGSAASAASRLLARKKLNKIRFKHKCPHCGALHNDETVFNRSSLYIKPCDTCAEEH